MYFILTAIKSQKNSSGKRSQFMTDCGEHMDIVAMMGVLFTVIAVVAIVLTL